MTTIHNKRIAAARGMLDRLANEPIIGESQQEALHEALNGEEAEHFVTLINQIAETIDKIPKLHATAGEKSKDITVQLHYFRGSWDWYVTEYEPAKQLAFGIVRGFEPELGYISLKELTARGVELDLHWNPAPLASITNIA